MTGPRGEFTPLTINLEPGAGLYRIFSNTSGRLANAFNPGVGARTRFAFFEGPAGSPVPVLYAAGTQAAAVCETLLHDIPLESGMIGPDDYEDKVMARLFTTRELRLASFMGTGLRALRAAAEDITATPASRYGGTVEWARAAYDAGYEGSAWMSYRCNTDVAYILFGDRLGETDLAIDPSTARAFALEPDRAWLSDFCAPLHIDVRW